MSKVEEFKGFVKNNPRLLNGIKNGSMTWQKYYEIYDLYGDDESAWKDYLTVPTVATATTAGIGIADVLGWLKGINLDSIQTGVGNLQRVIGMVQDVTTKGDNNTKKEDYKPRPLYRHFED